MLKCNHLALVQNTHSQDWITITEPSAEVAAARKPTPVMVEPDPVGRAIASCPFNGLGILRCLITLNVSDGYSSFVAVGGKKLCLKSVTGTTNGSPGVHTYSVDKAGQNFVRCLE